MKNGVREETAFQLDTDDLFAWAIIYGELDGGKFNWDRLEWEREE